MTLDHTTIKKNGFDILQPNNIILKKNNQGFWKVYYQSNIDPTEWIEDLHTPEIKKNKNTQTQEIIYTTKIGVTEEESKKNLLIIRTEDENNKVTNKIITEPVEGKNSSKPLEYFGTQPENIAKDLYVIEQIEQDVQDMTNWKVIAAIINKKNPFYYDKSSMWWRWNHTLKSWEQTDETDLLIITDKASKKNTLASSEKNKAIEAFKRIGRIEAPQEINDYWVQFGDTIVDVTTGEQFLASPKYFVTNPIPWKIGESTKTPVIDKLLKEWVGDKYITLKQLLAFATLPYYAIARIFFLLGSGSNGKSTYLTLLRKYVGMNNVCSVSLDAITNGNNKFATSSLYKKLVCQMGETNFAALQSTARLKELSGRDLVDVEFKGKTPFPYVNYAKIIIASNSIPETHDKTDGFFRRFVVVDFPNQFTELRDVIAEIPDTEYENLAAWSIQELARLLDNKKFDNEGSIQERRDKYEKQSDPLGAFIKEEWELDQNSEVEASQMYAEFERYLGARGMRIITYRVWRSEMEARSFTFERKRFMGRENPVAVVVGLRRFVRDDGNAVKSSYNTEQSSVSERPVVSAIPLITTLTLLSEKTSTRGTSGTNQAHLIAKLAEVISSLPSDNASLIESLFGSDNISFLLSRGDIVELPAGTYKLV